MKNYYFFKRVAIFTFFSFLTTSLWAIDETVPLGGNIQTAINNVAASGGGVVTLAAGMHVITVPLKIKSNITLQGEGNWASKIKTNTNINVIKAAAEGLFNITIQNIEIEGINGLNGGGIQITSQGVDHDNIKLLNVHCLKTGWGVHIKGAKNLLVKDCLFEENGTAGKEGFAHNMYLRRVYGAIIRNSRFLNSTSANGINISYSEDIEVYDCEMSGNYFRGVRAANTDGYLVHDCVVENNGNVGILANSEGVPTTSIDIRRNCISGNTLDGLKGVNGVTGLAYDNNSYNNGTDYSFPSTVAQSGNISNANIDCIYGSNPSVALNAIQHNNNIVLSWVLKNITLGNQDVYRDTDSDPSGRSLIASNVSGVSYTDNTAADDVPYWYWIEATDVSSAMYNSNAAKGVIATQSSVTLITEPGNGFVTLNWEVLGINMGNTGIQGVFRKVASDAGARKLLKNRVSGTTYIDQSAENGVTYLYYIKVTDEYGVNHDSGAVEATPSESLSINELPEKDKLKVFPNPVFGNLTVLTPAAEFSAYIITDMSGRVNDKGAIKNGATKFDIDVSILSKGIYILSVKGNQNTKILKMVKN